MLTPPKEAFDKVQDLARSIESNWQKIVVPESLKSQFSKKWQSAVGYPAIISQGQIRLYTSDSKSENVVDCDLAAAMCAATLRRSLHILKHEALKLSMDKSIGDFKNDFKSKFNEPPPNWGQWQNAIDSNSTYSDDDKSLLKRFISDSDSFYQIKGIARDDFATPAICKAITKRVDRFSIADAIASVTTYELQSSIEKLVTNSLESTVETEFDSSILPIEIRKNKLAESCTSKPFTILTGASGTGKTKLAESLAKHYSNADGSNSAIVAVGADWTDNRSTLGFVNHLGAEPIYQSSEILNLLLRANEDLYFPYFLILDEMNLSHVERYFADFLSVMEQKDGEFQLHDEGVKLANSAGSEPQVPSRLPYPKNLFVIGTVNIDETTYMFSPKVLDRANVIEFKVDKADMASFLDDPKAYSEIECAASGQAEAFLQLATKARTDQLDRIPAEVSAQLNTHLLQLFDLMQAGRFEFAYRSANETVRYMRVCHELTEDKEAWKTQEWETNFDEQIVQKILPKLHGSIGRIGKLIAQLTHFCHTPNDKVNDSLLEVGKLTVEGAKYKKSFAKLQSMASTLREEQFVSFIH